mmetsp:Transcript_9307/g.22857  ORF Transcript_9307/g.22857 Transcript_9307/m.22857 type:complete len:116 (+) Transcript_9307:1993-2340(+)
MFSLNFDQVQNFVPSMGAKPPSNFNQDSSQHHHHHQHQETVRNPGPPIPRYPECQTKISHTTSHLVKMHIFNFTLFSVELSMSKSASSIPTEIAWKSASTRRFIASVNERSASNT